MAAVEERLTKPLRAGRLITGAGLLAVLLGRMVDPTSLTSFLLILAGVISATWGVVRVTTWIARLRGRRSLSETAIGMGLVGVGDVMAVTAAMGPENRENTVILIISATGFALLGLALLGSAIVDYRTEHRQIDDPPPPPAPDSVCQPQPVGTHLPDHEKGLLRLTLTVGTLTFCTAPVLALLS